ncbi:hypothetical protein [Hahella ganghwensis]|uniref:hypothetical protein n=1 Tax=Hahella ganghwensis TaxID=286420 RepID=UPI00037306BA|nr:hypothetical protein [Hahella ganghwensis]
MKKLISILIFGPLIAFGVFKLGAFYQTHRALAAFQDATELHLALSYNWIGSSLDGEVTVEGVTLTPFQLREPILIGEVSLKFDSLSDMLGYLSPWSLTEELKVPDGLTISVKQAQVPLTDNWRNYEPDEETQGGDFFGLACGDIDQIGLEELREMGYTSLTVDQELSYHYNRFDNTLKVGFDTNIEGMQHIASEMVLEFTDGQNWPPAEGATIPLVQRLTYMHEDLSYMKRVMLMCGKRANLDQPEFIEASIDKTRRLLNEAGISLSPEMVTAYRTYLKGDGIVEVTLLPSDSLDLATIPFLPEDSFAESLGFSLKVNRVGIPNASFTLNMQQLTEYLYPPEPIVEAEPEPQPKAPPPPTYRPVELEELELYIEQPAKIIQHSGKVMKGTLVSVEPFQIILEQQMQSGVVSFHIKKSEITEAQILQ